MQRSRGVGQEKARVTRRARANALGQVGVRNEPTSERDQVVRPVCDGLRGGGRREAAGRHERPFVDLAVLGIAQRLRESRVALDIAVVSPRPPRLGEQ